MIVVGILVPSSPAAEPILDIARRAAAAGRRTEVVGTVPGDAAGDGRLIELSAAGVGHATVTRTMADPEAADVELALRYLPDVQVVVLVAPPPALVPVAASAAAWSGAQLILVDEVAPAAPLAVEPIVLDAPASDPDGTFAGFVAALAVRLDAGVKPGVAWGETVAALAADRVPADRDRGR